MSAKICPFCQRSFAIAPETFQKKVVSFNSISITNNTGYNYDKVDNENMKLSILFYNCPSCGMEHIDSGYQLSKSNEWMPVHIYPQSNAKVFPNYIPKAIRDDYEEACAIVNLSPKASATLSRRCLQSMINDFWNIHENTLSKSISALEGKIPSVQWKVIDGIRRIGNIGAHMEKDINLIIDIEPEEASKLIKMIELLLNQWYVERYEQELLYNDIINIDEVKQQKRKDS